MSYSAVILHVQGDAEAGTRLACAVDLAERFGAMLYGVAAEKGDSGSQVVDATGARLTSARARFDQATVDLGERASFCSEVELPGDAVTAASRVADLIVAGGSPRRNYDPRHEASPAYLAMTSGRPVLVVPPEARPLAARQVLLIWDDSREARRAMADAMPFFERAERVVVLATGPQDHARQTHAEAEAITAALKRRGVNAEAKVIEQPRLDGSTILRQADAEGADLVVCGADGHTRFGSWVLSGVTAELLAQAQAYLLLSH
jgi:nucleotide-binding universal stress UspA family protein